MVGPEFKRTVTSKVSLFFCHWKYCIRIAITDPNSPSEKPGFFPEIQHSQKQRDQQRFHAA